MNSSTQLPFPRTLNETQQGSFHLIDTDLRLNFLTLECRFADKTRILADDEARLLAFMVFRHDNPPTKREVIGEMWPEHEDKDDVVLERRLDHLLHRLDQRLDDPPPHKFTTRNRRIVMLNGTIRPIPTSRIITYCDPIPVPEVRTLARINDHAQLEARLRATDSLSAMDNLRQEVDFLHAIDPKHRVTIFTWLVQLAAHADVRISSPANTLLTTKPYEGYVRAAAASNRRILPVAARTIMDHLRSDRFENVRQMEPCSHFLSTQGIPEPEKRIISAMVTDDVFRRAEAEQTLKYWGGIETAIRRIFAHWHRRERWRTAFQHGHGVGRIIHILSEYQEVLAALDKDREKGNGYRSALLDLLNKNRLMFQQAGAKVISAGIEKWQRTLYSDGYGREALFSPRPKSDLGLYK